MTTVSAVVASLGLTGAVLLATAPLTSTRANAAQVTLADPTVIEPTDPTITDLPDDTSPEAEPTVTVTITESPDPTVTQTRTVTPKPKPTKTSTKAPKPTPSASKTSPIAPPPTMEPVPTAAPVIPSASPLVPTTPAETLAPDPQVSLEMASPTVTPSPSDAANMSFEDPTPDSVPIEIRNASPEYDQLTLSRKLAIPGVLLAVLVMLGVLIFEGRIRRMAHAAAVRRAGPRSPGRHRGGDFPDGYPMPGYPIYHGGTTYAPIISFVPVQGYPNSPLPPYQDQYGGPYDQGAGFPGEMVVPGQMVPPTGPSEPWPRSGDAPQGPDDATVTFPAGGQTPPAGPAGPVLPGQFAGSSGPVLPGQFSGDEKRTLQGPLPEGKQGRGLLGRFRRDKS